MIGTLVSVVVPTFARPEALGACLAALAAQTLDRARFDVVVVDDGGPVPVDRVVERYADRLSVTVHRQERRGPAAARNVGSERATGRLLAFTDDDCAPAPEWLEAMVEALTHAPEAIVGGRTINALQDNPYAEASQMLLGYLYAEGGRRNGSLPFVASSNLGLDRGRFEDIGGFDLSFPSAGAEDRDLCDRWRSLGRPVRYEPRALVRHAHVMGLRGFLRQHAEYGRGAHRLRRARARRGQPRLQIEPPSFYTRMLRYPFQQLPAPRAMPVASLVAVSQVATAVGYAAERCRPHNPG